MSQHLAMLSAVDGATRNLELGSITLRDDGILHAVFDFDGVATKDAAAEYVEARNQLAGTAIPPVLLEIIKVPYVERAIRTFFLSSLEPPPCRAVVVVDPALQMLYRSFELVEVSKVPTEIFRNVESAVAWIHSQTAS